MRKDITLGQLWILERDFNNLSPAVSILLEPKIKRFYQQNQVNLKSLHTNVLKIQQRYIETDEEGIPRRPDDKSENKDWLFREEATTKAGIHVTGPDVKTAYEQELDNYLNLTVTIEL